MSLVMMRVGEVHCHSTNNSLWKPNLIIILPRRGEVATLVIGQPSDNLIHVSTLNLECFLFALQLVKVFLFREHSNGHHSLGVPIQLGSKKLWVSGPDASQIRNEASRLHLHILIIMKLSDLPNFLLELGHFGFVSHMDILLVRGLSRKGGGKACDLLEPYLNW